MDGSRVYSKQTYVSNLRGSYVCAISQQQSLYFSGFLYTLLTLFHTHSVASDNTPEMIIYTTPLFITSAWSHKIVFLSWLIIQLHEKPIILTTLCDYKPSFNTLHSTLGVSKMRPSTKGG